MFSFTLRTKNYPMADDVKATTLAGTSDGEAHLNSVWNSYAESIGYETLYLKENISSDGYSRLFYVLEIYSTRRHEKCMMGRGPYLVPSCEEPSFRSIGGVYNLFV